MTTSSTLNQPIHDGKVYSCRHFGCDVVAPLSSEIRRHWVEDHIPTQHQVDEQGRCVAGINCQDCYPIEAQQFGNTRRGLANHASEWFKTMPQEKRHTCEFSGCDYHSDSANMSAAGVAVHYVFKHVGTKRADAAFEYMLDHGLEEVMDRVIRRGRGFSGASQPTPF